MNINSKSTNDKRLDLRPTQSLYRWLSVDSIEDRGARASGHSALSLPESTLSNLASSNEVPIGRPSRSDLTDSKASVLASSNAREDATIDAVHQEREANLLPSALALSMRIFIIIIATSHGN